MQHQHSEHVADVNVYHPPAHVARHLILQAIRNIPNKQVLLDQIFPKEKNVLGSLKPHVYNSTGQLQMAYY